jgi:hypothetical protein
MLPAQQRVYYPLLPPLTDLVLQLWRLLPLTYLLLSFRYLLFCYGCMHRPCEALAATLVVLHPLASACCIGIVTIVIATTPSNASTATMAIIAIDVFVVVISLSLPMAVRIVPVKRSPLH